jgi:type 2A phosphatase activator TIP41
VSECNVWAARECNPGERWQDEDLAALKVANAAEWAKGHKLRYGTDAAPPVSPALGGDDTTGGGGGKPGWGDKKEAGESYDWTYTTNYRGSVDAAAASDVSAELGAAAAAAAAWEDTDQKIDRGMLMERDPIVFFDEVTLYESELDDNGQGLTLTRAPLSAST